MDFKKHPNFIKKYTLAIGVFYFFENLIIAEISKGISLNFEKASKLMQLGGIHFGTEKPFVYISNRIHSYTIEPTSHYSSTELFPNLKGYGVVSYSPISDRIVALERHFMNKPVRIFRTINEAIEWANILTTNSAPPLDKSM